MQKWAMENATEIECALQNSCNPSVFITTPRVGGTGLNLTAATYTVITRKILILNKQWQVLA
jgi:hypothetical protein